jgi:uncharacterized protein
MTETVFAPLHGGLGGILIGLSATLLMYFFGRVAGLSGIFGGMLTLQPDREFTWRAIFIVGLLLGTAAAGLIDPDLRQLSFVQSPFAIAVGGILVGLGVTLGSGCTSGHGICGLSLFSKRSLFSTITFMAVAILTVFIVRHALTGAA